MKNNLEAWVLSIMAAVLLAAVVFVLIIEEYRFEAQLEEAKLEMGALERKNSYLEDLLRRSENVSSMSNPAVAGKKTIRPVLFFPSDYKINESGAEEEIGRTMKIVQAWYLKEVGATFSLAEPINFTGEKTLEDYKDLYDYKLGNTSMLADVLYGELGNLRDDNTYPVIFLYGFDAKYAFARQGRLAVISDLARTPLLGQANGRYITAYTLAHEVGHIFGLNHSERIGALMHPIMQGEWRETFLSAFPNVSLDEGEREILRNFLK